MDKRRLLMLADYLDGVGKFKGKGVPKKKFDLQYWMSSYDRFENKFNFETNYDKPIFRRIKNSLPKELCEERVVRPAKCQTAGCAVGWAATMPAFNKEGLFLYLGYSVSTAYPIYLSKNGTIFSAFEAIEKFFDINSDEFTYLFMKESYKNNAHERPDLVAARIREFVKCQVDSISSSE